MLDPATSKTALRRLFRRQPIVDLDLLLQTLETTSRMSVFRRLCDIGYLSSYTHRGAYYTLTDIPRFDELGLWFHHGVGFSRAGTLKATLIDMVNGADAGRTQRELEHLLRVRVQNTLVLLVREHSVGRERIEKLYVYVSAQTERATTQTAKRRERIAGVAVSAVQLSEMTVIEVLIEVLHTQTITIAPSVVAERLRVRGVPVTAEQVERVYAHYDIAGKKTAAPGSRPSRRSER